MDSVTKDRIATLHPLVRKEVEDTLNSIILSEGTEVRVTQALRTFAEQDALYAQGRTKPGSKVTNAAGGQSIHNYGFAFDYVLFKHGKISWVVDTDWKKVADTFKAKGWQWGGDWKSIKDNPHLEKTFGQTWQTLLKKYKANDFITGTKYVNIEHT